MLAALLVTAAYAQAQATAGTTGPQLSRKLAQSNGKQWDSKECVSWGSPKLEEGQHPHDYCEKNGGAQVCCFDGKCGGITCARGNRAACCPK